MFCSTSIIVSVMWLMKNVLQKKQGYGIDLAKTRRDLQPINVFGEAFFSLEVASDGQVRGKSTRSKR